MLLSIELHYLKCKCYKDSNVRVTVGDCDTVHPTSKTLTFWRRTFFQILAHPVFKM